MNKNMQVHYLVLTSVMAAIISGTITTASLLASRGSSTRDYSRQESTSSKSETIRPNASNRQGSELNRPAKEISTEQQIAVYEKSLARLESNLVKLDEQEAKYYATIDAKISSLEEKHAQATTSSEKANIQGIIDRWEKQKGSAQERFEQSRERIQNSIDNLNERIAALKGAQ